MDQVKVYLGVAKKHHFWILATIVVVTSVVVWMKASSSLATRYETDKKTITGAETAVQGANSPDLPNPLFTKKIDGLHDDLKKQVFDAWQKLYDRQVALFVWPELALKPTVDLNRLRPDEEIPEYVRTFYNERVVQPLWEEVLEQANIRRPKQKKADADTSASDDADADDEKRAVEYEGLVVWKPERREAIISRYYTPNATPSTAHVRLIQEDVWLFESLVKVVDAVNDRDLFTDSLKAPIKEIVTLDIAQWAIAASLESGAAIWTPDKANAGGGGMGANAMNAGMSSMTAGAAAPGGPAGAAMNAGAPAAGPMGPGAPAAGPGGAGAAAGGAAANDNDWLEGRFLDEKGQPLKAGATQPFAEFKQMFVYMKFIMDQRKIPNLIAACANAQLPIETRQVRVQMLQVDSGPAGGGLFAGGGGGMMPGMGMAGMGMAGSMGGMPTPPAAAGPMVTGPDPMSAGFGAAGMGGLGPVQEGDVETTVYDAYVELSGVIYLYQPPDITKLGTGAAGSPEKRSFGVPTTAVKLPGGSASDAGMPGFGGGMPGMGGQGMGGSGMGGAMGPANR